MNAKADYVRRRMHGASRGHHCHWPGCPRKVPPAVWGCKEHWYKLPADLRARIWRAFRPGQEESKTPSREYVEAAKDVQAWIEEHYPTPQEADVMREAIRDRAGEAPTPR